jgi:hypothetical protein
MTNDEAQTTRAHPGFIIRILSIPSDFDIRISSFSLHLHDLGFFVLEMIIDGFDEAIG